MKVLAELLGESPEMRTIRERITRLLQTLGGGRRMPSVLLQGETGTGQSLLARAIHDAGPRCHGPFVSVNCAAIPAPLIEAELFGFERGAFTDARRAKPGLFQLARGGTIVLDEIGLLPEELQGKLLQVVDERRVRRLEGTQSELLDAWIISASNEDLALAARERRFRHDLYYRLAVVTFWLPALRERQEDILQLANHSLQRACADYELPPKSLSLDAQAALLHHAWPGNVRELSNVIEQAALLSGTEVLSAEALSLVTPDTRDRAPGRCVSPLKVELRQIERNRLLEALGRTGWKLSPAAALLGIPRNTLRYQLKRLDLWNGRPGRARGP